MQNDSVGKLLLSRSNIINSSLSAISAVARNSINIDDKIVNFMCNHKHVMLMASDSSVEAQVHLNLNCNFKEVFSTNFEKIYMLIQDDDDLKLQLNDDNILFEKKYCTVKLNKGKVNCKPFLIPEEGEKVKAKQFLATLRALRKYLTSDLDDTSVIVINNQYTYARNRLFYIISDFKTENQYVINKFSVGAITSLFRFDILGNDEYLQLNILKEEGKLLISNSIAAIKVPIMRSQSIDLSSFAEIRNVNGHIVNKNQLIKNINELKFVEDCTEIDVVARDNIMTLSPAKEGTFTVFKVPSEVLKITDGGIDFQFTVNLDSFESMIKGSLDENLLFSSGSSTMLMMLNRSELVGIRYYMSVI